MNTITIGLSDLRFYAHHGVLPQETRVGNEFIVNLELTIEASGLESMVLEGREALEETISYADIYEAIRIEMLSRWDLLETIAIKISNTLRNHNPRIISGFIQIIKVAPPIPNFSGSASATYRF